MNWLDWLLVILAGVSFLMGWKQGLLRKAMGLLSMIIAFWAAGRAAGQLAQLPQLVTMRERIAAWLAATAPLPAVPQGADYGAIPYNLAEEQLAQLPIPQPYRTHLMEQLADWGGGSGPIPVTGLLYHQLAGGIVSGLGFLVVLAVVVLVLRLLLRLAAGLLDWVPVVNLLNRLAGAAAGILEALLLAAVALTLAAPFLSVPALQPLAGAYAEARLAPWLVQALQFLVAWLLGTGAWLGWG